jgi:hypothetical protein
VNSNSSNSNYVISLQAPLSHVQFVCYPSWTDSNWCPQQNPCPGRSHKIWSEGVAEQSDLVTTCRLMRHGFWLWWLPNAHGKLVTTVWRMPSYLIGSGQCINWAPWSWPEQKSILGATQWAWRYVSSRVPGSSVSSESGQNLRTPTP